MDLILDTIKALAVPFPTAGHLHRYYDFLFLITPHPASHRMLAFSTGLSEFLGAMTLQKCNSLVVIS